MNETQNLCIVKEVLSKFFHLFEVLEEFGFLKEFIHSYIPSKPCMINFFFYIWSVLMLWDLSPWNAYTPSISHYPKRIPHFLPPFDSWTSHESCVHTIDKFCSCYSHCNVLLSNFISTLDRMPSPQYHQLSENCQIH